MCVRNLNRWSKNKIWKNYPHWKINKPWPSATVTRNRSIYFAKFQAENPPLKCFGKGFNAMFAVNSVDAAKLYYEIVLKIYKR